MTTERIQWLVFGGLSFVVVVMVLYAYLLNPLLFLRFLGSVNPVLAIIGIVLVGSGLVALFLARDWFAVWTSFDLGRYILLAGLAGFMAAPMIFVDTRVVFPVTLNVQFPQSLLWPSILLTALAEPLLQTTFFAGAYPTWTVMLVGFHVFAFSVIELALFKAYDFVSMYWFRIAYYVAWHMMWGNLRLRVLF